MMDWDWKRCLYRVGWDPRHGCDRLSAGRCYCLVVIVVLIVVVAIAVVDAVVVVDDDVDVEILR